MSVIVESNLGSIEDMFGEWNVKKATAMLSEAVGNDSNLYVPYDTGHLHGSMHIEDDKVSWNAEYAGYVYEGSRTLHGGAEGHPSFNKWFEHAKRVHGDEWAEVVTDCLLGE